MNKPFLVTFTPLGRFFFGSTHSFKEGFYVVSDRFPQQSAVLGALRFAILKKENLLDRSSGRWLPSKVDNNKQKIKALTGSSPMNNLDETDCDFGLISRISPVFLVKKNEDGENDFLFPLPVDLQEKDQNFETINISNIKNGKSYMRGQDLPYAIKTTREKKAKFLDFYGGGSFWKEYISGGPFNSYLLKGVNIFKSRMQTLIARENRLTIDEAFAIKTDFFFDKGFAFGSIVHFSDSNCPLENEMDIPFGGEQSLFRLQCKPIKKTDHPIIDRFSDIDDFGDLYKTDKINKFILMSHLVFSGKLFHLHYAIIPDLYHRSFRQFGGGIGDTFRMVPACSVLFPMESNSAGVISWSEYSVAKKIGFNWALGL